MKDPAESAAKEEDDIFPPEPTKPLDSECCGTGCTPCVFDIYDQQLAKWKVQCDAIRKGQSIIPQHSLQDTFLTPEKYQPVEIIGAIPEAEGMKIFQFKWPHDAGGTCFPVNVGQHVLLRCQHSVSRQYTILRVREEQRIFDILIKIYSQDVNEVGTETPTRKMLTPCLDKMHPHEHIEMRGPFGTVFELNSQCSHLFLIAAGTGIAPMYRIIETILGNENDETKIKALFGCPSIKQVPLISKFKEWSSFWNFEIVYFIHKTVVVVDEPEVSLPYYGMKTVEHKLDLENLQEQIKVSRANVDSSFFVICGTKSFEKDVINWLSKIGVNSNKMRLF